MNHEIKFLGGKIVEKKAEIAKTVHEHRLVGMSTEERTELKKVEDAVIDIRAHFISLFGEAFKHYPNKQTGFDLIYKWGKETGELFHKQSVPLDEALKDTTFYRKYILEAIRAEVKNQKMSFDTLFIVEDFFHPLLDHAAHSFSLSYIKAYNESIDNTRIALLELSVPVVPITKGIAILPLIGNIDTNRAHLLMDEALSKASQMNLSHLIVDLSGVAIIDTMVADQLFKVISALNLIGVKAIFTGVRPEVSQTMIALGLNISNLDFKANVERALSDFRRVGIL